MTAVRFGTSDAPDVIRSRAVAVADYLLAVRNLVEKPARTVPSADAFWQHNLPGHVDCQIGPTGEDSSWLRVGKPSPPRLLPVPEAIGAHMNTKINPFDPPQLHDAAPDAIRNNFERWRDEQWRPWAAKAREVEGTRSLHQRLFGLRHRLDMAAATDELVWGHGVLELTIDGHSVRYPLAATPVAIDYDPDRAVVSVSPQGPARLQTDPLAGLDEQHLRQILDLADPSGHLSVDLWDIGARREFFTRAMMRLGHDAVIRGVGDPHPAVPHIHDTSVLFARPRQRMLRRFLQQLRERLIDGSGDVGALASVLAHEPSRLTMPTDQPQRWAAVGERLLMPMPTNDAQESIARSLASSRTVAVQGPPGTGKTHTIANLICHLMAHGKRVLVVAQKEDPLRVVRDKLPEDVRSLCLAVLGRSADQLTQLQIAARDLSDRGATLDQHAEQRRVDRLTMQLVNAETELGSALAALRQVATNDSATHTLDGAELHTMDVGEWLRDRAASYGDVPDMVPADLASPLSAAEYDELFDLTRRLTVADRQAALALLPNPEQFPAAATALADRAAIAVAAEEIGRQTVAGLDLAAVRAHGIEPLSHLITSVRSAVGALAEHEGGWAQRLCQLISDPDWQATWDAHVAACQIGAGELTVTLRTLAGHIVTVPEAHLAHPRAFFDQLEQLRSRFAAGKSVSRLLQPALARLAAECLVDGEPLRRSTDVELVMAQVRIGQLRQALAVRWDEWANRLDIPTQRRAGVPELWSGHLLAAARNAVQWTYVDWPALHRALTPLVPALATTVDSRQLAGVAVLFEAARIVSEHDRLLVADRAVAELLERGANLPGASTLWRELERSWSDPDLTAWDDLLAEVRRLMALRAAAERYRSLSTKLATVAPVWAAEIGDGTAAALTGSGSDAIERWRWRQTQTWFDQTVGSLDTAAVGRRVEQCRDKIRRLTHELVVARAWLEVSRKLDDRRRAALADWTSALRKIGKGTGKNAPKWQAYAQQAMARAVDAVPVWVMSVDRAIEQFADGADFDVVIADEASQADMFALPILTLADRAVVVGDDQQIGPQLPFMSDVNALIAAHLSDVPSAEHFDKESSLYDHAVRRSQRLLLTEHFRCVPPIIDFSSVTYYDGKINPLRSDRPIGIGDAVQAIHVPAGIRQHLERFGDVNKAEGDALIDRVAAIVADPAYDRKTLGVVSLLSSSGQALYLLDRIQERIGAEEMERRRLRVGDPYTFQGDERDVVLVSLVISPNEAIGPFTKRDYHRRVNVAASRARDQMWIFHSVQPNDLHADDARAKLLTYCQNVSTTEEVFGDLEKRCDSEFERQVLRRILLRGHRPIPQFRIGSYRIDFVLPAPGGRRLAIECDGDMYHGPEQWEEDMRRQAVLERVGDCVFVRIRGSVFGRDPEAALAPLWERIDEMRIGQPVDNAPAEVPPGRHRAEPAPAVEVASPADELPVPAPVVVPPIVEPPPEPSAHTVEPRPEPAAHTESSRVPVEEPALPQTGIAAKLVVINKDGSIGPRPAESVASERVDSPSHDTRPEQSQDSAAHLAEVPAGYRSVAWLRPHEAAAAIDSYQMCRDVPIRLDGRVAGWTRYHDSGSAEAKKYRANVCVERVSPKGARFVCWVRLAEAKAVVRAANARRDIPVLNARSELVGLVQFFPATSPAAATFRSVTRLLRVKQSHMPELPTPRTGEEHAAADPTEFHRAMVKLYHRARDEAGYNATLFLRMLTEHGGLATAQRLLREPHIANGFFALWERGRADLTVETLVLREEFRSLFTDEELAIAAHRLAELSM